MVSLLLLSIPIFPLSKTSLNLSFQRATERPECCLNFQLLPGKPWHPQLTYQWIKTPRGSWNFIMTDKPGNLFLCISKQTAQGVSEQIPAAAGRAATGRLSLRLASWHTSLPVSRVMNWCDFNQFWLHLALKVYSVQSLEAHHHSAPVQGRGLVFIRVRKTGVLCLTVQRQRRT